MLQLVKHCIKIIDRFKLNKKLFDSGKNVEISYLSSHPQCGSPFLSGLPVNTQRLKELHLSGEYTDVEIYVEGHGLAARSHKIILGLWSVPFAKVSQPHTSSFLFGLHSCMQYTHELVILWH